MKYKTTARALRKGYTHILPIDYCGAQYLLKDRDPVAYASGIYGWNFDVYDISDIYPSTAICTGYRGIPGNKSVPYALLKELEDRAKKAASKDERDSLLRSLVFAVWGNNNGKEGNLE